MNLREDKPVWSAVPLPVRVQAERLAGAQVTRAVRAFGGYGPSATFFLFLADGRRAFFKGVYPLPEGSEVRWMLDEEERVYERLGDLIRPWAPEYFGSFRSDGWHVLLIEAVAGDKTPPWTKSQAQRATRSFAEFHAATADRALPVWLSREDHMEFAVFWSNIAADDEAVARLSVLCADETMRHEARAWIEAHMDSLINWEQKLAAARRFALLHFDTRSDNVRLDGQLLRIFDWPFACVGPPEFDFAAFAQSIDGEGGPTPEEQMSWYSEVLALDDDLLTASVVGIAGYFADRAPRPELPGLPRLRTVQRRQLRSSLAWAARRVGLPEPAWLRAVAE